MRALRVPLALAGALLLLILVDEFGSGLRDNIRAVQCLKQQAPMGDCLGRANATDDRASYLSALLALRGGDGHAAAQIMGALAEGKGPRAALATYWLGGIAEAAGDEEGAAAAWQRAGLLSVLVSRAQANRAGRPVYAARLYLAALTLTDDFHLYQDAVDTSAQAFAGDWPALDLYRQQVVQAIRLDTPIGQAAAGDLLLGRGAYVEAAQKFEASIKLAASAYAYSKLGFTYEQLKMPEKSVAAYERSVALDDQRLWYRYLYAMSLLKVDRLAEALIQATEVVHRDPDYTE